MSKESNVLIITYYWPPAGGPGVQRWLKMVKYLPEFGVNPFILTVDPEKGTYPLRDESLEGEVPNDLKVFYTDTFEPFGMYQKATGRKEVPFSGFANESDKPGPRQKLSKFVRGNFFIPDARKGWNKYAYNEAKRLIDKFNIQTVITTGPPHSTHLIGLKLKKKMDVKWLADFRDPWTDIYYYNELYPTAIAKSLDKKMEESVLLNADFVAVVSNDMKSLFESKIEDSDKIVVVANGFDHKDFAIETTKREDNIFEILYTGTITKQYPIDGLLSAIKVLPETSRSKLRLRFVGKRDEITEKKIQSFKSCEVVLDGYMPHSKVVKEMLLADMLLLIIPDIENNKGILTGKIYEYLGSLKPILCLGPKDCDAEVVLNKTNSGNSFEYDSSAIKDFLESSLNNSSVKEPNKQEIEKFSRKNLAGVISQIVSQWV